MEKPTFDWLVTTYEEAYPELRGREFEELEWDLDFAILMARLRYRVVPELIPPANDVTALASYWKKHYNTSSGAGTVQEFISNWKRFGLG